MIRPTAQHKHQTQNDQSDNCQHLQRAQPKLEFAEELNPQVINGYNNHQKDRNKNPRIDLLPRNPILNDQGRSRQLIRRHNNILEPIRIPQRKPQRRIAEPGRIARKAGLERQPGGHLAQSTHDQIHDEAHNGVRDEDGAGPCAGEGGTRADDETGTDGAADGNHGYLTGFETAVEAHVGIVEVRMDGVAGVVDGEVGSGFVGVVGGGRGGRGGGGGGVGFAVEERHGW